VDATVTVFNDNVLQQLSWNRCININFIRQLLSTIMYYYIYLFIYLFYLPLLQNVSL